MAFFDGMLEFRSEADFWWISVEASHQKKLELPDCPEQRFLPARLCLCTVTDMGEIGSFRSADVRCLLEKIRAEYPVAEGSVYGRLLMGRAGRPRLSPLSGA